MPISRRIQTYPTESERLTTDQATSPQTINAKPSLKLRYLQNYMKPLHKDHNDRLMLKQINQLQQHKYQRQQRQHNKQEKLFSTPSMQQKLIKEIGQIDASLQHNSKHLHYQNGLLFDDHYFDGLAISLVNLVHNCSSSIIQYGFNVLRLMPTKNGINVINTSIVAKHKSINNQLIDRSIQNIQAYQHVKQLFSQKHCRKQWSHFSKPTQNKHHLLNQFTLSDKTTPKNTHHISQSKAKHYPDTEPNINLHQNYNHYHNYNNNHNHNHNRTKLPYIKPRKPSSHNSSITQAKQTSPYTPNHPNPSQSLNPPNITLQDIKHLLKKCPQLVSIWLPPSTCPQFYGVFAYKLLTSQTQLTLRITRYYFYRHSLNPRLFDSILQWASHMFGFITELQLLCQRQVFISCFEKCQWKMRKWCQGHKLAIAYRRKN